jgi:hypothetical protein
MVSMKTSSLLLALVFASLSCFGQKYMTRTGKVSFFSSTPMENIEAVNNEVASALDASNGSFAFQVLIKSFRFEKSLMQEHFNENYMESDLYPKAEFKGKLVNPSAVNFAKDGKYEVSGTGQMTIHGVTKTITVPATVTVEGKNVTVVSKFKVKPSDYGIKIPSVVAGKVASEIEVTVSSIMSAK